MNKVSTRILALAVAFMAMPFCTVAQHNGVNTNAPNATWHIHSTEEVIDMFVPQPPRTDSTGTRDFDPPTPPDPNEHHYQATLLITNSNTGTDTTDGLLVRQLDGDVTISQQESGLLRLQNHDARLVMNTYGMGVGSNYSGYKFNVEGKARFSTEVKMLGTLTIGSGFSCDTTGNMKVKHLKVTLTDWPDYVFGGDYRLMPLNELEAYLNENSHLPGVPSAEALEKEGADLGEMDRVLMEKVEELTLYIIDLQKQIDELKPKK